MLFSNCWMTIPEKKDCVVYLLTGVQPNGHDSNPGKYCPVTIK